MRRLFLLLLLIANAASADVVGVGVGVEGSSNVMGKEVRVIVPPAPPPPPPPPPAAVEIRTFQSTAPDPMSSGGGAHTISWTTENATSCIRGQDVGTDFTNGTPVGTSLNGSIAVTTAVTQTYYLVCQGPSGPANGYLLVNVTPTPAPTTDPTPPVIIYFDKNTSFLPVGGGTVVLSWTAINAEGSCVGTNFSTNPPYSGTPTSGTARPTIAATTTFRITCTGSPDFGETTYREVSVTVAPYAGGGACTDGVNCLCDTISPVSTLLLCEDFEAAGYYEDTAASWRAGSGSPHNRGGDSEWENKWGNADGNLWSNISEPFSPYLGTACGFGPSTGHQGCTGTKEYCSAAQGALTSYGAADCWGPTTNDGARVDMQRSGDVDAEVPGLTLTGGIGVTPDVLADSTTLAYRVGPGAQAGKFGDAWLLAGNGGVGGTPVDGNTNATEVGITMLLAYSSNIGTEADSVIDAQWKHNEWATDGQGSQEHWNLGNSGCGNTTDFPYRPFLWAASEGACITALAGATETVGNADCSDAPALILCSTTAYDQATDFPYGTVACHQAHIKGLGTNDVDIEIKHDGVTVIKLENFDGSALANSYYSNFIWNAYSNINEDNDGTTNDTDEAQYRYEDNIVVVNGPPESCASIGF